MSKEAMKQALDAFKDLEKNRCLHYPKVVKALEEALKQEQGELVCVCGAVWENGQLICTSKQEQGNTKRPVESDYLSYTAYTRALEAYCDEQEKADTVDGKTFDRFVALNESNAARILELEAQLAEQEQEPVACIEYIPCCTDQTCPKCKAATPPQQRKPLTLGQKQRLWSSVGNNLTLKDRVNSYVLAIEAAHGIKK